MTKRKRGRTLQGEGVVISLFRRGGLAAVTVLLVVIATAPSTIADTKRGAKEQFTNRLANSQAPVSATAREQPRRLVSLGTRGVCQGSSRGQADFSVGGI